MTLKAMYGKIAYPLLFQCLCFSSLVLPLRAQESDSTPQPQLAVTVKQYTFTLNPGASYSFPLPKVKNPIRIEVALTNYLPPSPKSALMWALFTPSSVADNWIGTNNDGSTITGSTEFPHCGPPIVDIYDAGGTVDAVLAVSCTPGLLSVTQTENLTIAGTYIVRVYY